MLKTQDIRERLYRTALRSPCRYRIAAIAFDEDGTPIAAATNTPRLPKAGGGFHAEQNVLKRCKGRIVKEIWIVRLGNAGALRPIQPCPKCAAVAQKLGIKIRSLQEI